MLVALLIIAALVYFREQPESTEVKEATKKSGGSEPIAHSPALPPVGTGAKASKFYSPLTTPVPGTTHMRNPRMDPVPSIFNNVLNVDSRGENDELFYKQRQIYTNWNDIEENEVLDNFKRNDFPMRGAPLINGLNRKDMVNPTQNFGMFVKDLPIPTLSEKPWM